jgi:hypothetical protein
VVAQENFRGVRGADLMAPEPRVLASSTPLEAFVYDEAVRRGHRALGVVDDGRLLGYLTRASVIQYLALRERLDLPPGRRGAMPSREGPRLHRVA